MIILLHLTKVHKFVLREQNLIAYQELHLMVSAVHVCLSSKVQALMFHRTVGSWKDLGMGCTCSCAAWPAQPAGDGRQSQGPSPQQSDAGFCTLLAPSAALGGAAWSAATGHQPVTDGKMALRCMGHVAL